MARISSSVAVVVAILIVALGAVQLLLQGVMTADLFDNGYYKALVSDQGVFTSDVALTRDPNTSRIVIQFAQSKDAFFAQFAKSMAKLTDAPRPAGNVGEIRRNCFSRNAQLGNAGAGDVEGFAASA